MFLLLLSFFSLWSGPAMLMLWKPSVRALRVIDALVIGSVLFLVVFHVIPESIEHAGMWAGVGIGIGALWPIVYQILTHSDNCYVQRSLLSMASVGILIHTWFDGMAIAQDIYLGLAVALHRLPEGLGLWRAAELAFDKRWGILALCMIMVSTGLGFFFGNQWFLGVSDEWVGIFEGLMAGVLLHVVFHRSHVQSTHT